MTEPDSAADAVRLLSYNVRYAGLDTGPNAWEGRRDGVASDVRFHRPDVVALQEVWMTQLDDLRDRLPALDWVGHRVLDGEHTPIGYRPDRFAVTDSEVFALSETPDAYDRPGWDATLPRLTTRATLRSTRSASRVTVLSTHFDHEGERARRESARLLRDRVADVEGPAIVAGDLNCGRTDEPYRLLTADGRGAGLADARAVAAEPPHGPAATYNDFDAPRPGETLDHVLVTDDVDVDLYGVPTTVDRRGRYPSDHFPVVVDVHLDDEP